MKGARGNPAAHEVFASPPRPSDPAPQPPLPPAAPAHAPILAHAAGGGYLRSAWKPVCVGPSGAGGKKKEVRPSASALAISALAAGILGGGWLLSRSASPRDDVVARAASGARHERRIDLLARSDAAEVRGPDGRRR